MASTPKAVPAGITAQDLLAAIRQPSSGKTITARVVNGGSIFMAKTGAAFAASADNFSQHYDMERVVLKQLADIELQREATRAAARLNAALASA